MSLTNGVDEANSKIQADVSVVRRGRKRASESRATEIRKKLWEWKQTPEAQRISLRALAAELRTSHQLLSFYLRRWDKWQIKQTPDRAKTENRSLAAGEEAKSGKLSGLEKYVEELCKAGHGKEAVELLKLTK